MKIRIADWCDNSSILRKNIFKGDVWILEDPEIFQVKTQEDRNRTTTPHTFLFGMKKFDILLSKEILLKILKI